MQYQNNEASTSHNPDLGWSQLRETIVMLKLAIAHIDYSLTEGESSIDTLTQSFTDIVHSMQELEANTDAQTSLEDVVNLIHHETDAMRNKVQNAIIAFQFYDALSQRLSHVSHNLDALGQLINDSERLYSPRAWHTLQNAIREKYTIESDKKMFDAVLNGMSIDEAIQSMQQVNDTDEENDIEFF